MQPHSNRLARISALFLLFACSPAAAQVSTTGRWTNKLDSGATWSQQAVHMVLTRGYGGHHSQILWYDSNHAVGPGFLGGVWGWTSNDTTANQDCTKYPASMFVNLPLGDQPPHNIFCTGHSSLADGRILITGGTEGGETGVTTAAIFDPATRTWDATWPMAERRWYPTTTTLPDGRALVSSGSGFIDMQLFGGRDSLPEIGPLANDSLQRIGLSVAGEWIAPAKGHPSQTLWPGSREGHSATWLPDYSQWVLFGGRGPSNLLNDTWFMNRQVELDPGEKFNASPVANAESQLRPGPRFRHSSIARQDTLLIVYGGRSNLATLGDVWELRKTTFTLPITYSWTEILTNGTGPGARQGHGAVHDPVNDRMLVFGGADASDDPIDNTLYALSLDGSWTWTTPAVEGTPPPARHGHVFLVDPLEDMNFFRYRAPTVNHKRRILVFGGEEATGLSNGLWALWIPNPGSGANYRWQQITPSGTSGPSARYRLAADADHVRFTVQGGDVGGGLASAETWAIDLPKLTWPTDSTSAWTALPSHPGKELSGHTALTRYLHWSRRQEIYDPALDTWSPLDSLKRQDWYPFHFVMPHTDSLRVFFAGPTDASGYLVLGPTSEYWRPFPAQSTPGYRGGSAVMYVPGKVMRCGSRDTDRQTGGASGVTQRIDLTASPSPSAWTTTQNMGIGRVNHNLVILPTGDVLVTGGTSTHGNSTSPDPVFTPQIWSPATEMWTPLSGSSALASDAAIRGYHSNAILLPDGRVLTASGTGSESSAAGLDSRRATVFCPPYLFDANGNLRSRPTITATVDTIVWGHAFSLTTPQAGSIASACLIKPAASTHAFNQDQRFVPLPIGIDVSGEELVLVGPANGRVAPPGDYLLFIVGDDGVPSVGRWVRVEGQGETGACADVTPARIELSAPEIGRNSALLRWDAPGENGACGTSVVYDLRRRLTAFTDVNFYDASSVEITAPVTEPAGFEHCLEVDGLTACKTYYLAIKARDSNGHWSALNEVLTFQTDCSGYETVLCDGGGLLVGGEGGGGGSGQAMSLASAGPVSGLAGEELPVENTLLRAGTESSSDLHRLAVAPDEAGGRYAVRLRQAGSWQAALEELSLGVVDHDPALASVAGGDRVFLGTITPVEHVTGGDGAEVVGVRGEIGERPLRVDAGAHLDIRLPAGPANTALVLEARGATARVGESDGGILVQRPGEGETWTTIEEVHPRRAFDRIAVAMGSAEAIRLVFRRPYTVRLVARMDVVETVSPVALTLTDAEHARTGSVAAALADREGASVSLVPGDEMSASFAATPRDAGKTRAFFLSARGSLEPARETGSMETAIVAPTLEPAWTFGAGDLQPNPSRGATAIEYTMAHEAEARVLIYDVAGRLVRTLVHRRMPAGSHVATWDGRDDGGRAVGGGVYFYRMTAGDWRGERKLIVLRD